jgi:hypothetical protein
MGEEFCGIVPTGAKALLRAMNRDLSGLGALVTAVRGGGAQAGEHLDADAKSAERTLQGYLDFLHYWGRELQWRIRYMESLGAASRDGQQPWQVAQTIPFENHRQAARFGAAAGTRDGQRLKAMWDKFYREYTENGVDDPVAYEAFRRELERTLASSRRYRHEPGYAGSLLRTLGARNIGELLRRLYRPGMAGRADDPQGLSNLPREFAGLAQLFATADRGGTLPKDVRSTVLDQEPRILATFLRAGMHTDQFALDAAKRILGVRESKQDGTAYNEWVAARHLLLDELWQRPGVTQALLADPDAFAALSDPDLLRTMVGARPRGDGGGPVTYQYDLAAVLWRALDPDVGTPQTRARAWATVIKANQSYNNSTPAVSPEIARVLAERIRDYFPYIAYQQAVETGARPSVPAPQPALPRDVKPGEIGNFLVSLAATADGRDALRNGIKVFMENPVTVDFLPDGRVAFDPETYRNRQNMQIGLLAALYRGFRSAKLTREEQVTTVSGIVGSVVDAPVFGAGGVVKFIRMVSGNLLVNWSAETLAGVIVPQPPDPKLPGAMEADYRDRVRFALKMQLGREPTRNEIDTIMNGVKALARDAEGRADAEHGKG